MCGLAGELRFDGTAADVATVEMTDVPGAPRPRRLRRLGARTGRAGPPAAVDHRPVRSTAPSRWSTDLGLTVVFNGCIYNYADCAPSSRAGHRSSRRPTPR